MLYGINKWFDMIGKAYAKLYKKCLVEKKKNGVKKVKEVLGLGQNKSGVPSLERNPAKRENAIYQKKLLRLYRLRNMQRQQERKKPTPLKVNNIRSNRKK